MSKSLSADVLRIYLKYSPATGEFFWLLNPSLGVKAGDAAGTSAQTRRYAAIRLLGRSYQAHRLAWLWMTGNWPIGEIDHIDGDRANNRWANLRDVPRAMNAQNKRHPNRSNRLGLLGVCRDKNRFRADITTDGRRKYLGSFMTPDEAHAAYLEAKRNLHKGNTL